MFRGGSDEPPVRMLSLLTRSSNKCGGGIEVWVSGVTARDSGDADPVDSPDDCLFGLCALCPGGGVPFSDLGESKRLFFLAD